MCPRASDPGSSLRGMPFPKCASIRAMNTWTSTIRESPAIWPTIDVAIVGPTISDRPSIVLFGIDIRKRALVFDRKIARCRRVLPDDRLRACFRVGRAQLGEERPIDEQRMAVPR